MQYPLGLRPLADCIKELEERRESYIKDYTESTQKETVERIQRIERYRPIIAMLDAEGFKLTEMWGSRGEEFTVDLGFFASTGKASRDLADQLRTIRLIFGCKLGLPDKGVADCDDKKSKGHLQFTLRPDDMPKVRIRYTRRLPKGAKCKIVTTRSTYRRLVCEAS